MTLQPRVRKDTILLLGAIYLAILAGAFENVGLTPYFPDISQTLSGNNNVTVIVTSFTCASFIGTILAGRTLSILRAKMAFVCASLVQALGLTTCLFAPDMPTFVTGRALQGLGEGYLTVLAFFLLTQLFSTQRAKSCAIAGVSVAWLVATAASPIAALILSSSTGWRTVIAVLIIIAVVAILLLALADLPDVSSRMTAAASPESGDAARKVQTHWELLPVVVAGVLLSGFGAFAANLSSSLTVIAIGVVLLISVTALLVSGRLGLAPVLSKPILGVLAIRGATSSLYFSAISFAPLVLVVSWQSNATSAATVVACATLGWTLGAVAQTKLSGVEPSIQMAMGLFLVGLGVIFFGATARSTDNLALAAATLGLAGVGSGITNNILPVYLTTIVGVADAADRLSSLETVDTVWSTIVISVVGAFLIPTISQASSRASIFTVYATLGLVGLTIALTIALAAKQRRLEAV